MLNIAVVSETTTHDPTIIPRLNQQENSKINFDDLLKTQQKQEHEETKEPKQSKLHVSKSLQESRNTETKKKETAEIKNDKKRKSTDKNLHLKSKKNVDEKKKKQVGSDSKNQLLEKILHFLGENKGMLKEMYKNNHQKNETFEQFIKNLQDNLGKLDVKDLKLFLDSIMKKQIPQLARNKKTTLKSKIEQQEDALFKITENGKSEKKIYVNKHKVKVVDMRTKQNLGEKQKLPNEVKQESGKNTTVETKITGDFSLFSDKSQTKVNSSKGTKTLNFKNPVEASHNLVKFAKLILSDKKSVMKLDLKPDSLGKIFLKIELVNNKIQAQITTNNEFASDVLKQNMAHLQEAFKEAGLDLESLNVEVSSGEQESDFENFKQSQQTQVNEIDHSYSTQEVSGVYELNSWHSMNSINYIV